MASEIPILEPWSRPKLDLFVFGARLLPERKNIKKYLAQTDKHLIKRNLGHQRLQFWCLFDAIWTSILNNLFWPPKSLNLQQLEYENLFFYHFRPPILASKIDKQIMFFPTCFLDLISLICFQHFQKMVDLGTPSKSNRFQNYIKNPPSGAKTPKIVITWRPQNEFLKQPCARDANWSGLGPLFHDFEEFGILSDLILNTFQCILASLLVLYRYIHIYIYIC